MSSRRIFLSYTHDEIPFVRSVAAELVRRGIDAQLDIEGLTAAHDVSDQLQDALRSSSVLVAFLGNTQRFAMVELRDRSSSRRSKDSFARIPELTGP